MVIIIFEISSKEIKKTTLYSYCVNNNIQHFKNNENTHYYTRFDTNNNNYDETSYILMRKYLEKRGINFNVLFTSLEDF